MLHEGANVLRPATLALEAFQKRAFGFGLEKWINEESVVGAECNHFVRVRRENTREHGLEALAVGGGRGLLGGDCGGGVGGGALALAAARLGRDHGHLLEGSGQLCSGWEDLEDS
jgi:hypothetical protein